MIYWLSDQEMLIRFELYKGKEKADLLNFVRAYRNKFQENEELMGALESVLHPEDWQLL